MAWPALTASLKSRTLRHFRPARFGLPPWPVSFVRIPRLSSPGSSVQTRRSRLRLSVCLLLGVVPLEEQLRLKAEAEEGRRLMRGGKHYKRLKLLTEYPGIYRHDLLTADKVNLAPETAVAGLEVDGQHYAFVLETMVERHIANLVLDELPISVTYCDLADCVRVFTLPPAALLAPAVTAPLKFSVGGLDIDNRLVLLLDEQRYSQESKQIPAADYPFDRMRWDQWLKKHPDTLVYLAPPSVIDP